MPFLEKVFCMEEKNDGFVGKPNQAQFPDVIIASYVI